MENKCRGCKKRFVGCHAQCEDYKMWKEWDIEQQKIIKSKKRKARDYFYSTKGDLKER